MLFSQSFESKVTKVIVKRVFIIQYEKIGSVLNVVREIKFLSFKIG